MIALKTPEITIIKNIHPLSSYFSNSLPIPFDIQKKLSQEHQLLWNTFSEYTDGQKEATQQYVKKQGVPNYLPTKQEIEEKKYAEISEAFSPVAIACLQDKLSEEHKLCVLIYADSCVDEDESKLPILYKFLRFCLAIHIFSEDFILKSKSIPLRIKKAITIQKIHKQSHNSEAAKNKHDLKQAIIHKLTPANVNQEKHKAPASKSTIANLAHNWFNLDDSKLKSLAVFCKAWSNGEVQKLIPSSPTTPKTLTTNEGKLDDLTAAQYLATIFTLPKPIVKVLRNLHTALTSKKTQKVTLDNKALKIAELTITQRESLIQTFLYLENLSITSTQAPSSKADISKAQPETTYSTEAFNAWINEKNQNNLSSMLTTLYKSYFLSFIKESLNQGLFIQDTDDSLQALKKLVGAENIEKLMSPLHAEACLKLWNDQKDDTSVALLSLSKLLEVNSPLQTLREDIVNALLQKTNSTETYQPEYTQIIFELMANIIPTAANNDKQMPETHTILADLERLITLEDPYPKHVQLPNQLLNLNKVESTDKTLLDAWKDYLSKNPNTLRTLLSEPPSDNTKTWLNAIQDSKTPSVITSSVTTFSDHHHSKGTEKNTEETENTQGMPLCI